MEQKVHDLDNRLKQMKEERDQVIQENEELQEQLDMTNTNNSVGKSKVCLHAIRCKKISFQFDGKNRKSILVLYTILNFRAKFR